MSNRSSRKLSPMPSTRYILTVNVETPKEQFGGWAEYHVVRAIVQYADANPDLHLTGLSALCERIEAL